MDCNLFKIHIKMRTLFFFLIFAGLMACNPQPAAPVEAPPAQAEQVTESGEPLGQTIINAGIEVYCSYHLVRGAGAIQTTGAERVTSKAWQAIPAGQRPDNALFIKDAITTLEKEGVLAGVDLTKTKSNWLIILYPGASPRKDWVLDSRDLYARVEPVPAQN